MGLAQLEQLPKFIESKRKIAEAYKYFFINCHTEAVEECVEKFNSTKFSITEFFSEPKNARSNYWLNTILFENREKRDRFLKYTNENGIITRPAWTLMNKFNMFKDCYIEELSISECLEARIVNIPSSIKKD